MKYFTFPCDFWRYILLCLKYFYLKYTWPERKINQLTVSPKVLLMDFCKNFSWQNRVCSHIWRAWNEKSHVGPSSANFCNEVPLKVRKKSYLKTSGRCLFTYFHLEALLVCYVLGDESTEEQGFTPLLLLTPFIPCRVVSTHQFPLSVSHAHSATHSP